MRIEEGKKTISELAKKENYIIKILIEAELQEKRENEGNIFNNFIQNNNVKIVNV